MNMDIVIQCSSPENGKGRTATIERMRPTARGGWDLSRSISGTGDNRNRLGVVDNKPIHTLTPAEWSDAPSHDRYRLRCKLCGLTVLATDAKLNAILDRLQTAGRDTIELSTLKSLL